MNATQIEQERTIRIRDLFITICQRWRSLVVCFVIGAIVFGAYGWIKSGNDAISTPEQAAEIVTSLGSKRAGVIESYAEDIKDSTDQMIRQGKYNKDARIMKLDPFHLYVHELKYYISGDTEWGISANNSAMVQAYVSKLQSDFLGQKLKAVIEEEAGEKQREFYESPTLIKVDEINQASGIVIFLLYFEEGEETEAVSQLKEKMRTAKGSVQADLGEHTLSLIGESSYEYADMDILHIQEANSQRINDLTERIEKVKKQVTDEEELKYLNYLIAHSDDETSGADTFIQTPRYISKKYILIGAILGMILAVIVIIIKYVASNSIKNAKELEIDFGLQVLGTLEGEQSFYQKRRTKLDKWLRNKKNETNGRISDEEMIDLISTKIKIEAKKADLHQICLAVDMNASYKTALLENLIDKIGDSPSVIIIRNIQEQPDGLEDLSEMDGIVLVEQIEQSGYDDLKKICALCCNYQVNVIGSIVLD